MLALTGGRVEGRCQRHVLPKAWAPIHMVLAFLVALAVLATACGHNDSSVSGPFKGTPRATFTTQQEDYLASVATSSANATAAVVATLPARPTPAPPTPAVALPAFRIVSTDDVSHKALDGPLSSYSSGQLQALPLDKSVVYRVVVPPTIQEVQVRPLLTQIVSQVTTQDADIDEVSVLLYSDEALIGEAYDVGHATWEPELGTVTPRIALTNAREGYKLTIDVPSGLDEYLKRRAGNETKFGLTEAQRRQIFKKAVAAEDRAHAEADRAYPLDVPDPNFRENNETYEALVKQYYAGVREPYGLTEDQLSQIEGEGGAKRWPFD